MLIFSPFFWIYSISWHPILPYGCQLIERQSEWARMTQKTRLLHELPYTNIEKSGTIRLASGCTRTRSVCFVSSSWPQISIRTTVQYMYSVQYLSMYIMLDDFIYVQFLCTLYIHVARLSGPNRQLPAVLRGAVQYWPGSGNSKSRCRFRLQLKPCSPPIFCY